MARSIAFGIVAFQNTNSEILSMVERWSAQTRSIDQTFVVANSSLEDSAAIRAVATVLDPESNIGFAAGANLLGRAAQRAGATHLLLANLDVEILSTELLQTLENVFATTPDATFVSPAITLWPDTSRIWYRGAHVARPIWVSRHPGINQPFDEPSGAVKQTGYFSGCCVLIDLGRFNQLGGFNEALFMYYDEADLSLRASAQGWHSYFVDLPMLAHEKPGRKFTPNESYWHARNSRLLLKQYEHGFSLVVGQLGQWLMAPVQMTRCDSRAARRAYVAGLRGRPAPPPTA